MFQPPYNALIEFVKWPEDDLSIKSFIFHKWKILKFNGFRITILFSIISVFYIQKSFFIQVVIFLVFSI